MTTATISSDQDSIVCEIEIAAPPERVFQALIDPKQVMQWWTSEECRIESFEFEPRRGGRWRYDTRQSNLNINGVSKFHCEGEVLEYDPPRVLATPGSPTGTTIARSARWCAGSLPRQAVAPD